MKDTQRHKGFSLIELIGVMAIISILAAIITPNIIKRIDLAAGDAESTNLIILAKELEQYMTTTFSVPSSSNWSTELASISSLPASQVAQNKRGFLRGFYVDPLFLSNIDTAFTGYTQTTGLLAAPVNPRIMFISDLTANAPAAPTTSAAFNAIWEQTTATTLIEGDNLKIHRMYLGHLFHQLILLNRDITNPFYQLNNSITTIIPAMAGGIEGQVSMYVIHGTQLNLHQSPFPTGTSQYTLFIHERDSFVYGTNGAIWFWGRP